jgi:Xaa-Pro aminopeptidase
MEKLTEAELGSIRVGVQGVISRDMKTPELPFPKDEYMERIYRLREMMAQERIDLLFMTAPDSMCYFHGYCPSYSRGHGSTRFPPMAGTAIHIGHGDAVHFDSEGEQMLLFSTSIVEEIYFMRDWASLEEGLSFITNALSAKGWLDGTVGMELWSHLPNRVVSQALEDSFLDHGCKKVVDATRPMRALRRTKSPKEIAYIEEATRIADTALEATKKILRPGLTELEVYGEVVRAMSEGGGEPPAWMDVIQAGPYLNWHGIPSRRKIRHGDLVLFDLHGVYNRYHSMLTRGCYLGRPPAELVKLYRLAGIAFDVLSEVAKAGTPMPDVCRALKAYYQEANIWELREWCGGIELGLSLPPDLVGEIVWDVEEETGGVFKEHEVTYYFGDLHTLQSDVYVYEKDKARRLSKIPLDLIVID